MDGILQGTTPTLTIGFNTADLLLSNVSALELTFDQMDDPVYKHLEDVTIDTDANSISYHFTQEETLALLPTRVLNWQVRLLMLDGNIIGTTKAQISVADLISDEVLT